MDNPNNSIPESNEESFYGVRSFLWEVAKVFFWALVIIVPIRVFLFQPFFVQGASMEPNFKDGDYLIVNELGYKQTNMFHIFTVNSFKDFDRGDVIVFRYPLNPTQFFIKRVIGLPGEKVEIKNGKVTIYNKQNPDGLVLDEQKYISEKLLTTGEVNVELDDQQYFVLGDNRNASHDSRAWGPLPKEDVIGKVLIRAWPVSKAEIL